jgi:predicted enzyme related to lactoylglutathione lyase
MHKSKLGGFIIDCRTDDLGDAAAFWGAALGMPVRELPGAEGELYRRLDDGPVGLHIEVQKVEHPSRVHLDIETDDIEAEVRRLEGLGARRLQAVQTWVVMEAPTGQRFCVVEASSPRFETQATKWP